MIDNQWPSPYTNYKIYNYSLSESKNYDYFREIETFFEDKFNCDAILTPSGRTAIAMVIRFKQINRSHSVYITKWSSHCMFNTIGAFTNTTVDFVGTPDMIVINHKWGQPVLLKNEYRDSVLIEDSVDSIFLTPEALFPNNADFEIISLPKIIGSYSGGIIFSKDKNFTEYVRNLQKENLGLAKHQSRLKCIPPQDIKNFETWLYHEAWNTSHDANSLTNILNKLSFYEDNKRIITQRLELLQDKLGLEFEIKDRIGPVYPLSLRKFKIVGNPNILLRNHSFSPYLEDNEYESVHVLPLHFGISDKLFQRMLLSIKMKK